MGYLRNVRLQYWITFFHALIPAYVIERLFWQLRGMNVMMVVYCEIIYAVTVAALEIPSGVLADRLGRKRMLCVSAALSAAEMAMILFAYSFWQFALAVFLAGIGKAVCSGSENALLYDSLLAEGRQASFEKRLGRIRSLDFASSVAAALSGGVLAKWVGFSLNYIISVASLMIALVITLLLQEPPRAGAQKPGDRGFLRYAGDAFLIFKHNPAVRIYCLTGAVLGACFTYLDEFWQLLAEGIRVPVALFGVLGSVILAIRIPGNLLAYKLKRSAQLSRWLTLIVLLHVIGFVLVFILRSIFCLVPLLLVALAAGVVEPLVLGYLHHHTASRVRATAESIYSLGLRCIGIVIGLAFGTISTKLSIFHGFLLLAGVSFLYLVGFLAPGSKLRMDRTERLKETD